MHGFFIFSIYFLCLVMLFYLYRITAGPDVFDRLIGLNGLSTKAVIVLIFGGAAAGHLDMVIDIALGYGLLNLVGMVAVGKYLEKKGLTE